MTDPEVGKYFNAYPHGQDPGYVAPGWSEWEVPSPTPPGYYQFNYQLNVNGTLVQGFLYNDLLSPIAELNAAGQVVSRFVYGSRPRIWPISAAL